MSGSTRIVKSNVQAFQYTGTEISFYVNGIYGEYSAPESGNITEDLSHSTLGLTQKIYHEDAIAPTFPAGWVLLSGVYIENTVNMIYAEWSEGTRVEYWIVNE